MQRNGLESESLSMPTLLGSRPAKKKRAKTTHKLDGSGKGGEGEGKLEDDAPELLVFRYTVGSSGAVFLRLCVLRGLVGVLKE